MKWKAEFSIGIETLDIQHRKVFDHLLAIENSLVKNDPWNILRFLIDQLSHSLSFHLAVEDTLLEVLQYPQRVAHHAAHVRLQQGLTELEDCLRNAPSPQSLVVFFEQWFIKHVLEDDLQFVAYVREKLGGHGSLGSSPCRLASADFSSVKGQANPAHGAVGN